MRPSRSASLNPAITFLVAGVLGISFALILGFLPLVECPRCKGEGYSVEPPRELTAVSIVTYYGVCTSCGGRGRTSAARMWMRRPDVPSRAPWVLFE